MSWSDPRCVPRTDYEECMAFAVQCCTLARDTLKYLEEAGLPAPTHERDPHEVLDLQLRYWHRFNLLPPRQ